MTIKTALWRKDRPTVGQFETRGVHGPGVKDLGARRAHRGLVIVRLSGRHFSAVPDNTNTIGVFFTCCTCCCPSCKLKRCHVGSGLSGVLAALYWVVSQLEKINERERERTRTKKNEYSRGDRERELGLFNTQGKRKRDRDREKQRQRQTDRQRFFMT